MGSLDPLIRSLNRFRQEAKDLITPCFPDIQLIKICYASQEKT